MKNLFKPKIITLPIHIISILTISGCSENVPKKNEFVLTKKIVLNYDGTDVIKITTQQFDGKAEKVIDGDPKKLSTAKDIVDLFTDSCEMSNYMNQSVTSEKNQALSIEEINKKGPITEILKSSSIIKFSKITTLPGIVDEKEMKDFSGKVEKFNLLVDYIYRQSSDIKTKASLNVENKLVASDFEKTTERRILIDLLRQRFGCETEFTTVTLTPHN